MLVLADICSCVLSCAGMCVKCGRSVMGEKSRCVALDQLFHVDCFRCTSCSKITSLFSCFHFTYLNSLVDTGACNTLDNTVCSSSDLFSHRELWMSSTLIVFSCETTVEDTTPTCWMSMMFSGFSLLVCIFWHFDTIGWVCPTCKPIFFTVKIKSSQMFL